VTRNLEAARSAALRWRATLRGVPAAAGGILSLGAKI